MIKAFLFATFLTSLISYSQNNLVRKDSLIWVRKTCESGIENAENDFTKKIYNSFSYGFVIDADEESEEGFDEFYKTYMFSKYSLNIEERLCYY